jgi:nucleotide-binding universal stress UspA family protein
LIHVNDAARRTLHLASRAMKRGAPAGSLMIKNIVVNLSVSEAADAATAYAVSVAAAFEAHLAGIAFAYEPSAAEFGYEGVAVSLIESERAKSERAADAAIAKFEESARRQGLSAESHRIDAGFANAGEQFAAIARRHDLSIVTQPEPRKIVAEGMILEAALFDSGRPVLAVPYIQKTGFTLDRAMVCWDGSRTAARAAGDALPFLARARKVDVVMVTAERIKSDEMAGADIAHHLARHGLDVSVQRIVAVETDVANTILSHAADAGTDFLVMGGYGHSRLREFVLGGATRGILGAMTVPVLMSH